MAQSSISYKKENISERVRKGFIQYWNIIDQHGAQFELYVNKFETVMNDEIKKLNIGISNVFEITNFEQYKQILSNIISNNSDFAYLLDTSGPTGVRFYTWSTNRHYRNFLNIISICYYINPSTEEIQKKSLSESYKEYLRYNNLSDRTIDRYFNQVPKKTEIVSIIKENYNKESLFDIDSAEEASLLYQKIKQLDFDIVGKGMYSSGINKYVEFLNWLEANKDVNNDSELANQPLQQIYFGAPGTGKSHEIKKQVKKHKSFRITFHPDTDYSSFVGAYKPTSIQVPILTTLGDKAIPMKDEQGNALTENKIVYTYVKQAFLNAYIEAWKEQEKESPKPVFLVIEEINRGNCAQIFGDIFQLLDRNDAGFSDYSIVPDRDLSRHVSKDLKDLNIANREKINAIYEECEADMVGKVLRGDVLLLPNNLYIWATMNTSDQSLFPIDSAFKRRWDWKYIKIANAHKNWQIKIGTETFDWWQFVQAINYFVFDATQSEDKNLGYFFAKAKDKENTITAETFVSKVIFYLYTDVFKDYGFSGDIFKGLNDEEMTFQSFYNADGSPCNAQIIRFIKNVIYSDSLPEHLKAVESEEARYESNGKKKLVVEFSDGTIIKESTQFASYIQSLKKIGLDKAEQVASSKRYSRLDCPLVSKTQYDAILNNTQGFSYVNIDDFYIIKGIIIGTMNDFLNQISSELDLNINSYIETNA